MISVICPSQPPEPISAHLEYSVHRNAVPKDGFPTHLKLGHPFRE